jgi:hypothetical protein
VKPNHNIIAKDIMTVAKKTQNRGGTEKKGTYGIKKVVGKLVLLIKFNMLGVMAWKSHNNMKN